GGMLMADTPAMPGVRDRNLSLRDKMNAKLWYEGVRYRWEPYISEVYRSAAEPPHNVIGIAIPIKDEDQKIIGILTLQVLIDRLMTLGKNIEANSSEDVYFVDKKGHISDYNKFLNQTALISFSSMSAVKKVLQGRRGVENLFNPMENEEFIVAY